ncbi:MAG TPA: aminotransferase class I/II-fold pyridoxal phosphate-dependent enzyme, partial [Bacillota bacterium]|nr:aminotransferase class I/II-fold pyridoxal phosphate-dependent enzyme [Bacillota bacterium]
MSKYWNTNTKNLEPYVPGEQPKDKSYIKLNTNENPYPPSPRVLEAIKNAANENLRLYPDPGGEELRQTIAGYYNLAKDHVFVGNGSDEILAFSFAAFFEPGRHVLFPDITYSFYPVYADLFQLDYQLIPLGAEFTIPTEEFFLENGGIIIPNPHAPTGKYLPISQLEPIIDF